MIGQFSTTKPKWKNKFGIGDLVLRRNKKDWGRFADELLVIEGFSYSRKKYYVKYLNPKIYQTSAYEVAEEDLVIHKKNIFNTNCRRYK
jgi:hypothetical protein